MKAITLTQPWATLVAIGAKQYETRSWSTNYRGPLAIHAAKGFPKWARELCWTNPFFGALQEHNLNEHNLPLGAVVAVVFLGGILHTEDAWNIGDQERAFGDYSPKRYAWLFGSYQRFNVPQPAKGALGLWEWPEGDTYTEDDRLDRMAIHERT